jgi:hypothetical protein
MPNLKLIYFKMRALAEAPQLMLHYSGTPYSYEMGWDYFGLCDVSPYGTT